MTRLGTAEAGPDGVAGGSGAAVRLRAGLGGEPHVVGPEGAAGFAPTRWGARLTGPATGPVKVDVDVGCCAEIRAGAGPGRVTADVRTDGLLAWFAGPEYAADDTCTEAEVRLASNARLLWADAVALGGGGDAVPPGAGGDATWRSRLRITRDGWPLLASDLVAGPVLGLWSSPALLSGARAVVSAVVVEPGRRGRDWKAARRASTGARAMSLPLAGPGCHLLAWGEDLGACCSSAAELLGSLPAWAAERWERWAREERVLASVGGAGER